MGDFGWAVHTPETPRTRKKNLSSGTKERMKKRGTFCGTTQYIPPEIAKNELHDSKVDIWSLGILTYEFLFGNPPFDSNNVNSHSVILEMVKKCTVKFPKGKKNKISDDAKVFIKKLLHKDAEQRMSIDDIQNHPFIVKNLK